MRKIKSKIITLIVVFVLTLFIGSLNEVNAMTINGVELTDGMYLEDGTTTVTDVKPTSDRYAFITGDKLILKNIIIVGDINVPSYIKVIDVLGNVELKEKVNETDANIVDEYGTININSTDVTICDSGSIKSDNGYINVNNANLNIKDAKVYVQDIYNGDVGHDKVLTIDNAYVEVPSINWMTDGGISLKDNGVLKVYNSFWTESIKIEEGSKIIMQNAQISNYGHIDYSANLVNFLPTGYSVKKYGESITIVDEENQVVSNLNIERYYNIKTNIIDGKGIVNLDTKCVKKNEEAVLLIVPDDDYVVESVIDVNSGRDYSTQIDVLELVLTNITSDIELNVKFAKVNPILEIKVPKFDSVEEGYLNQSAKEIIITNTGNVDVNITNVSIDNTSVFKLVEGDKNLVKGIENTTWKIQPIEGVTAGYHTGIISVTFENGFTASEQVVFEVKAKSVVNNNTPVVTPENNTINNTENNTNNANNTTNNLKNPQTGDNINLFVMMLVVSIMGILGVTREIKIRK